MIRLTAFPVLALMSSASSVALAQTSPATPPAATEQEARDHHAADIVVTGVKRKREDILGGVSVLDGTDLTAAVRPTLGETLAKQPGVSATSFGPNASRPILRGLGGDRIRVLTDGIGSLDVSTSSADHAVAINPLTAERIEVLRGPAALLFGSSAIGGVVNVIDARIPRREPERPLHVDALLGYGTASDERAANVVVDIPLVSKLVLHGDFSWTKTDDMRIGGHVLSSDLREQALASGDPEIEALADLKGTLPNTAAKTSDVAGGVAWVDGPLNVGFSVTRHDNLYGVPVRYALEPGDEAEKVQIDVKQWRYDARAEIPIEGGFLEQLRLRGGVVDYRHNEIEEDGSIASTFYSDGGEGRLEAVQRTRSGWGGAFGAQYLNKKVHIDGEEKFLPENRTKQFGVFALQTLERGPLRGEIGGRVEWSKLTAKEDLDLGNPDLSRKFTALSGSIGASYLLGSNVRAGLSVSRSERAPAADELFANGPHAGTQAFEIGDPDFDKERSLSIEASLRRSAGPVTFAAALYTSKFSDYIFLAPTGAVMDDLPVYTYRQGDARYYGFEVEAEAQLGEMAGVDWSVEGVADAVRAKVKNYGPAPQIPPLRLLGAVAGKRGNLDGRLEVEQSFAQNRTAPGETETSGFTLFNAALNWRPLDDKPELILGLSANNIFDVTARRHASLLKDYAPLAGRDFRVTARVGF